jgi:hypothetical protein
MVKTRSFPRSIQRVSPLGFWNFKLQRCGLAVILFQFWCPFFKYKTRSPFTISLVFFRIYPAFSRSFQRVSGLPSNEWVCLPHGSLRENLRWLPKVGWQAGSVERCPLD